MYLNDICCILRIVGYDVCHLIMFVGTIIWCLSYYEVCLIMLFVSLWSLTPIMTFVAHRVCHIWCHMYCASSKSAIHFTNLLTCVQCTLHSHEARYLMDQSSFHPTFSAFIVSNIHPVLQYIHPVLHPSCLTSILSCLYFFQLPVYVSKPGIV